MNDRPVPTTRARWGAAAWAVGVTAILAVLPWTAADRLPDPLATHWSGSSPDGSMPLWAASLAPAAIWAVLVLAIEVTSWSTNRGAPPTTDRRPGSTRLPWTAPALVATGVILMGAQVSIVRANLDRATWHDAGSVGLAVVLALVAAAVASVLAWLVTRRTTTSSPAGPRPDGTSFDSTSPAGASPGDPRLDIPAGERFAWLSRTANPWVALIAALTGLTAVAGLLAAVGGLTDLPWGLVLPTAFASVAMLVCSSVQALVTPDGLSVAFGPLGWPVRRWSAEDIASARAEHRTAAQAGGWGYRMNGLGTTVMLRSGECLVIRTRKGTEFAVSVGDAERGAALLNSLVARQPS
ncbi:DUF1648 domain-containing protein [Kitasatospora sp. NPDC058170]|uniref:DUF1648 domain-containing protein n=1 Tax=Kitasatospora sp. NPDC058170 TaxID=3346364 RepID=UPI0036D9D2BF